MVQGVRGSARRGGIKRSSAIERGGIGVVQGVRGGARRGGIERGGIKRGDIR